MYFVALLINFILLHLATGSVSLRKSPERHLSEDPGNGNEFVDQLLQVTKISYAHELDPHPLPDIGVKFAKRILIITYEGQAQLHNGTLTGLLSMHRADDCKMIYDEDGGMTTTVHIGMGELKYDYYGTLSLMGIGSTVGFYGSIAYLSIEMVLEGKPEHEPKITMFKINELKGFTLNIRKFGILNWIVRVIANAVFKSFKPVIKNILEKKVRVMVEDKLRNLPM